MRLPGQLASAFYPVRGLYSSADRLVLGAQAAEIRAAGIDVLVSSWWGRGSFEDERLGSIQLAAGRVGLDVAVHLEPYPERTPESTRADVEYLVGLGIGDFYLYGSHDRPASEWQVVTEVEGARIFAQTSMAGYAAAGGFDGLYTYDVLVHNGAAFARICAAAHARNLLCAPSVGPGYDARRAVGDTRVKLRRGGRTYDTMWRNAIARGPTRSRSRATTSGTRGRRSSLRGSSSGPTATGTSATRVRGGRRERRRKGPTSTGPSSGAAASEQQCREQAPIAEAERILEPELGEDGDHQPPDELAPLVVSCLRRGEEQVQATFVLAAFERLHRLLELAARPELLQLLPERGRSEERVEELGHGSR